LIRTPAVPAGGLGGTNISQLAVVMLLPTLPAASRMRTRSAWLPGAMPLKVAGDVQAVLAEEKVLFLQLKLHYHLDRKKLVHLKQPLRLVMDSLLHSLLLKLLSNH
jgi:hypothetical protein